MRALLRLDSATDFIKFIVLIALYYLAYRYPFQINYSGTSSTYSDTPFILQVLKYALFVLACAAFFVKGLFTKRLGLAKRYFQDLLFFAWVFAVPLYYTLLTADTSFFETGIFLAAVLLFLFARDKAIDLLRVRRWVAVFLVMAIAMEMVQLFLFAAFDRLPALAYRGTISVRFGSLWDDPNGFSFMLSFLIPFVVALRMRLSVKAVICGILLLMLLLTQSLTGVFSFAVALLAGTFLLGVTTRLGEYWKQFATILSMYIATVLVFFTVVINLPIFQKFLALKSGSIQGHMDKMAGGYETSLLNFIGLAPMKLSSENGYLNMLYNFGAVYVVVYGVMLIYVAYRLARKIHEHHGKPGVEVYYGAFFFLLAFAVGMMNLPLDHVFPLNLLVAICIVLSYGRTWLPHESEGPGSPL